MLHFYWCKIQNVTISLIIFNAKNSDLKKSAMRGNENWFVWHQNPFNYVICDLKLVSDIKGQPWMISRPSERSCYVWKYHIRPKFWSQLDILPNILDILYQKQILLYNVISLCIKKLYLFSVIICKPHHNGVRDCSSKFLDLESFRKSWKIEEWFENWLSSPSL